MIRDATGDESVADLIPDAPETYAALADLGFEPVGVVWQRLGFGPPPELIRQLFGPRDVDLALRSSERGGAVRVFIDRDRHTFAEVVTWFDGPKLKFRSVRPDGTVFDTVQRPTRRPDEGSLKQPIPWPRRGLWPARKRWWQGYRVELHTGDPASQLARHRERVAGAIELVDLHQYLEIEQQLEPKRPDGFLRVLPWITPMAILGPALIGASVGAGLVSPGSFATGMLVAGVVVTSIPAAIFIGLHLTTTGGWVN